MKQDIDLQYENAKFLDWTDSLKLIPNKEDKNILELGCGVGTQYLCNEFKNVYSFEVYSTNEWFEKSKQLLSKWNNWNGTFYTFEEIDLVQAETELRNSNGKIRNENRLNTFYKNLNKFVDLNNIDVVFVDQAFHLRAETVNYFMKANIPFIFAHDTKQGSDMYGWPLVYKRDNYDMVLWNSYQGVTYWIKK